MVNSKEDRLDRLIKSTYKDMFENERNLSFGSVVIPSKEVFLKGALDKLKASKIRKKNTEMLAFKLNKPFLRSIAAVLIFVFCLGIFFAVHNVGAFKLNILSRIFKSRTVVERSKDLVTYKQEKNTEINSREIIKQVYEKLGMKENEIPFKLYLPSYLPEGFSVNNTKFVKYIENKFVLLVNYKYKDNYLKYRQKYDEKITLKEFIFRSHEYEKMDINNTRYYLFLEKGKIRVYWIKRDNMFNITTNLGKNEIKRVLASFK